MDNSNAVELGSAVPTQAAASAPAGPANPLVQSRFRRAMQGAASPHAFRPRAAGLPARETENAPSDAQAQSSAEIVTLLERACSALYVGERDIRTQRILLMLDHVLPGAAAEIVREGAHLTIRLYARTEAALRLMTSQRASLLAALGSNHLSVNVTVVDGAPAAPSDERSEYSK